MVSLALDSPELAAQYDQVGQRQFTHGKSLIADLAIAAGETVLDLGCGTGLLGAYVADIVGPTGRVIGIDPLPLRVELAKRKNRPSFQPEVGRAEDLSGFAKQSFDAVYLNSVIHWLPDQPAVLREVRRILKPNGRVGFTTRAKERNNLVEQARKRALAHAGLEDHPGAHLGSPNRLSSDEVRELFRASGLREKQILVRTFTDYAATIDDVIAFSRASSFGNHLSGLTDAERGRFRQALAEELERERDAQGIRLDRHIIFAIGGGNSSTL
jgi:arsenite methyltransferase